MIAIPLEPKRRPAPPGPRRLAAALALGSALAAPPAFAQAPAPGVSPDPAPTFSDGRVLLFPSGDLYPAYIADPHRPTNALSMQFHTGTEIEGAQGVRTWLAAGGRFGTVRFAPREPGGRWWQVSIEAGLDAQYDSENKLDNVGYDGNYGLTVTTAGKGPRALKLAYQHVSGHVGDEWAEETGRERIGYTRDELAVGAAVRVAGPLRVYGEVGWAFHLLNDGLQEPWRLQGGGGARVPADPRRRTARVVRGG